ncbi:hypothetical protein ORV05_30510 [Amycolatopsis cynarae]|uniref:Uncharacterized protein n=1 Tax=Amycolatopsis cynarae TaxID=2995223 RepID=A0ABY7B1X2_9PSEU|nr:hypothetical protein [Amycolatopsis sp. HUAS 11-8]WAL65197.1 hypothetical protein ORV05_30510 [Amycolatopsis sp. HUAS 11-8]
MMAMLVFSAGLISERVALSYALAHWDAVMAPVRGKRLEGEEIGEAIVNDLYRLLRMIFLVTVGLVLVLLPFVLRRSRLAAAVATVLSVPFAGFGSYIEIVSLVSDPATSRSVDPVPDPNMRGWSAFCQAVGGPLIVLGALAVILVFFLPATRRLFRARREVRDGTASADLPARRVRSADLQAEPSDHR